MRLAEHEGEAGNRPVHRPGGDGKAAGRPPLNRTARFQMRVVTIVL